MFCFSKLWRFFLCMFLFVFVVFRWTPFFFFFLSKKNKKQWYSAVILQFRVKQHCSPHLNTMQQPASFVLVFSRDRSMIHDALVTHYYPNNDSFFSFFPCPPPFLCGIFVQGPISCFEAKLHDYEPRTRMAALKTLTVQGSNDYVRVSTEISSCLAQRALADYAEGDRRRGGKVTDIYIHVVKRNIPGI